jgi:tetratricopeptide (TPR) repeat protein
MNTDSQDATLALVEERVEVLFRELELACRWQRSSITFALYPSESVRQTATQRLEEKLNAIGQTISLISLDEETFDFPRQLSNLADPEHTVLFLDGFSDQALTESRHFEQLNRYREHFIDNAMRAVFWLREQDLKTFTTRAAECWGLRHRVIDFSAEISPAQHFLQAIETFLQTCAPDAATCPADLDDLPADLIEQLSPAATLLVLGLLLTKKQDHRKAIGFYRSALDIARATSDPEMEAHCLETLADAHLALKEVSEAIALYKESLPLASQTGKLWKKIGLALLQSGEDAAAVDALLNASIHLPKDAHLWTTLGNVHLRLQAPEKAIAAFAAALELAPSSAEAWLGLGNAHLQRGEFTVAQKAFQKVIAYHAANTLAWLGLGQSYLAQNKAAKALLVYQKAVEVLPEEASLWQALGLTCLKQNEYEKAITALEKALNLQPDSGEACRALALAEYQRGHYERAALLFEQAIPLFDDRDARRALWEYLADTQRRLNNEPLAQRALQQARRLAPKDRRTPVSHSSSTPSREENFAGKENPMMESLHTFETLTAQDWNDRGNSYLQAGDYRRAIHAYTKAVEMSSGTHWPYIKNLAIAHYHLGRQSGKRQGGMADPNLWDAEEEPEEHICALEESAGTPSTERQRDNPDPFAVSSTRRSAVKSDVLMVG